jgi:hypothetical protein
MKNYIVVLPVEHIPDGRKLLEDSEAFPYDTVRDAVNNLPQCELMDLSAFMDACNNEEMDLVNNWIGYIQVASE